MSSTNGLQNNSLVVATIDGLTSIYATAIYDNGVLLDPGNYVPYSGAVAPVNLGGQELQTSFVPVNGSDVINLTALTNSNTYVLGLVTSNFVPYTGATSDTTLGTYKMSSSSAPTTGNNFTNKTYVDNATTALVPYTGATSSVDLGSNNVTAQNVIVGNATTAGTLSFGAPSGGYLPWKMFTDSSGNLKFRTASGTTPILFSIDNVGNITTSQTVYASTAQFSGITSATPALALGVDGSGNLRSFAVPTATNLLPLNNTWTGTNTFNNSLTTAMGTTSDFAEVAYVGENLITSAVPTATGISASAPTPTGAVTFSSPTYTLTPSGASTFASCWSSATFVGTTRCFFNFTNASLPNTPGSATITVCQANAGNTAYIAVSSAIAIPQSASTFSGYFAPNTNSSYLGQVFFIFSNIKFNPFSWTAFSYGYGSLVVQGNQTNYGATQISNGVAPPATGSIGGTGDRLVLYPGNSGTYPFSVGIDGSTLWHSVPNGCQHLWYVNGTTALTLTSDGALQLPITKPLYLYYISSTNYAGLTTNSSGDMFLFTGTSAPANRITALQNGNVGIGTNSPASLFHVNGTIRCDNDSGNGGYINLQPTTASTATLPYIEWKKGATRYAYIGYNTGSTMYITTENGYGLQIGYASNNTIYIDTSNRVGIQNASPSYYLDVNTVGTTRAGSFIASSYGQDGYGQFRMVYGNYGVMWRQDGGTTYLLITNSGDQYGAWNSLRPFYVENSTGTVTINASGGSTYLSSPNIYMGGVNGNYGSGYYMRPYCYDTNDGRVQNGQSSVRSIITNNSVAWSYGITASNAFYMYSGRFVCQIQGYLSFYVSSPGFQYFYLLITHVATGTSWSYQFQVYVNATYSHMTFPYFLNFTSGSGYNGWYNTYMASNGGYIISDTGDQFQQYALILPTWNY